MATCPNCGEIVMNGDPYCSNCGATLRWISDEEDEDNNLAYFLQDFRIAKRNYDEGDYSKSFMVLLSASTCYTSLSRHEKRELGEDPMKENWAIDVICRAFNSHDTKKNGKRGKADEGPQADCKSLRQLYHDLSAGCSLLQQLRAAG